MIYSCAAIFVPGSEVGIGLLSIIIHSRTNTLLAMQIQYNITRIEEWCKSHGMPEGTLQLEHLMQATKLLQLKKVRLSRF